MKLKLTILGLTLLIFSSMNIYSRALRHISIRDVKQKHQEKIVEKIQEEVKKKEEKQYIQSVMETKKHDWRKELNEMMTTADVFFTNLPATGDVNLEFPAWPITTGSGFSVSGGNVTISAAGPSQSGFIASFDSSIYTTVVFDVIVGGPAILGVFGSGPNPLSVITSSGTYSVSSRARLFTLAPGSGSTQIRNLRYQRRTPMNVFVSLDSLEASSFIRTDPMMSKLSPVERQKKLKEMLASGDEYVRKMLGADFPGTGAVPPGEYDPFKQAPAGKAGDTPGVEISQAYPTPPSYVRDSIMRQYGKPGYGKFTPEDQKNILKWQQKIKQADTGSQDTQIAAEPLRGQKTDVKYDPKMKMFVPKPSDKDSGQNVLDLIRLAHYEPQGGLISEKKLKSPEEVLNKIPGYYDGKPAPLGFPETPPPEMVNGMHPDLVDGKKIADRFNRLDPQSAKAMPLTGNPHIDKKVKGSVKKPSTAP